MVLEAAPAAEPAPPNEDAEAPSLLALSGQTPEALRAFTRRYLEYLAAPENTTLRLSELCRTANVHLSHHRHRLAVVGGSLGELGDRPVHVLGR